MGYVVTNETELNLREERSSTAPVVGKAKSGEIVELLDTTDPAAPQYSGEELTGLLLLDAEGKSVSTVRRYSDRTVIAPRLPTLGKVTGGCNILQSGNGSGVTFGFNAQNTQKGMKGSGVVVDHNIRKKVRIIDVTFFAVAGAKAVFMGRAEVNGVEEK